MSTTIDERIVAMKFNNADFQKRIADTLDSLRRLKDGINLGGAKNALVDLDRAGKNFNLNTMAESIEGISSKFSAMSVVGIAALATLAAKATDVALDIAKKFVFDPAMTGFQEYETQINAVQTILSNTQSKGTTIDQVNEALEELNSYADQTIYNFSAMTQAIGTFTVAGVGLEESTAAVKGFSNVSALAGANATSAAGAMRQLALGISSGTIRLQDWMSIETAGIAGEQFQEALKTTARAHGVAVDDMIAKNGSFRLSLQEDWLTSEIMTQTLTALTGDLSEAQLVQQGYTAEQAKELFAMAQAAKASATEVKTFTQLMGTLAEASGSGWAKTWQIVLGDFVEAKALFTDISNTFGAMIQASAEARNGMLQDWKDLGGRAVLIEALTNVFKALMSVFKPIQEAFREIFPPMTGQRLYELTVLFRDFTRLLILNDTQMSIVKNVFKIFFGIIKTGLAIVGGFISVIGKLFGVIFSGGDDFDNLSQHVAQFFQWLADGLQDTAWVTAFFTGMGNALAYVVGFMKDLVVAVGLGVAALGGFAKEGASVALTRLRERLEQLGAVGQWFADMWGRIATGFQRFMAFIKPITDALGELFADIGTNIVDAFSDVEFSTVLDLINVRLLGAITFMIKKFLDGGIWSLFGKGAKEGLVDSLKGLTGDFKKILTSLTDTLEVMQTNIKADTLLKIAGALALLTASVVVLSLIDSGALTKALIAMGTMFYMLNAALVSFSKTAATVNIPAIAAVGFALILFAAAIGILTGSVVALSTLSWGGLIKGLGGVLVLILGLSKAVPALAKGAPGMITAGIGLIAIATAIRILVSAVEQLGALDTGQLIQGLLGIGAVLAGLLLFNRLSVVNKGAIVNGAGLILLATALKILASAVSDFASMNVGGLIQGIGAMGVVLATLAIFMKTTANVGQMIAFGTGLVILGAAMKIMASAVADFGNMSVESLVKGLIGLAAALGIIAVALLLMPPSTLASAASLILVGAALKIIAAAVMDMGGMTWDEIGRGMVVLAGSLLIIAGAMYLMTAALPGAAALIVVAAALAILAPVLKMLGSMTWDEIGRGLVALGGALLVLGLAAVVLTPVLPMLLLLGVAVGLIGAGLALIGVGVLAFALGLTLLAAAGLAALPVIVGLVTGILALIPLAMEMLGQGIVAFAKVIGESAPVFLEAFVALLLAILTGINTLAPEIVNTFIILLEQILEAIVEAVPMIVDAALRLITGILQAFADNIDDIAAAATDLMIAFLTAIDDNMPKLIDKAAESIVKFVEGLAIGIENNRGAFVAAGSRLFRAIVDGVSAAIAQGGSDLRYAGESIGNGILQGAMNALGINSPSKEFRDHIMGSVFEGIEDGNDTKRAYATGAGIGTTMIAGVSATLSSLSSAIQTDLDMNPTITPVLDMTQFKRDAQGMGTVLSTAPVIRPTVVAERAQGVQTEIEERTSTDVVAAPIPTKVVNVKMEQTNNSPESLSTAEIYRRTNNQVNQVKGILEDEDV